MTCCLWLARISYHKKKGLSIAFYKKYADFITFSGDKIGILYISGFYLLIIEAYSDDSSSLKSDQGYTSSGFAFTLTVLFELS